MFDSIIHSIILGLVQGLTELLPISSSGHLILARKFLGLSLENTLGFDILLHLATLFAIVTCFWGDLRRIFTDLKTEGLSTRSSKLVWAIIVGSIPATLVGFFLSDWLENSFRNPENIAYSLILGSAVFFLADRVSKIWGSHGNVGPTQGFLIGLFQSLALIPGISRSGITISGGLLSGLSREESIRFAFLLGIPITLGAILKTFLDFNSIHLLIFQLLNLQFLIGFLAAFLSGLWAVRFLIRFLSKNSFTIFIVYRVILAIVILFLI